LSRTDKERAIGNCVPAFMLLNNLEAHLQAEAGEAESLVKSKKVCEEAIREYMQQVAVYYRASAVKKARNIAERVYYDYFAEKKFSTAKVFMTLHAWVFHVLSQDDLIDIYSEEYRDLWFTIDDTYAESLTNCVTNKDGIEFNPKDIEKKYLSAQKHVTKIHKLLLEQGLYQPLTP